MSRTSRYAGGLAISYLNQFLVMLVGLWVTPGVLGKIGQRDYGLWLVVAQGFTYLTLCDFGLLILVPRELAYRIGRSSRNTGDPALQQVLGDALALLAWQTPFWAIVFALLWVWIPPEWDPLRAPIALTFVASLVLTPARIFQAALLGMQDLVFTGKVQLLSSLLLTVVSGSLVFVNWGLLALPVAWIFSQIVLSAFCYWRLKTSCPGVLPAISLRVSRRVATEYIRRGFWVTVAQLAQVLLNGTDLFLIGKLLGPAAVVPFAFTGKLISILANQPAALMQLAAPALSEMKMSESPQRQLQACNALCQASLLLSGAIATTILLVNGEFVSWWVGGSQFGGVRLTLLLVTSMLLRHWVGSLVYASFCFGGERRIAVTTMLDGLLAAGFALLLLPLIGVSAAPLGSIAGACVVSLPVNLLVLARATGRPVKDLLVPLTPWFWRLLLLLAAVLLWQQAGIPANVWAIGLTTAAAALLYATVMLRTALQGPLGIYLRPALASVKERFLVQPALHRTDA